MNQVPQMTHCFTHAPPGPIALDSLPDSPAGRKATAADIHLVRQIAQDHQCMRLTGALTPDLPETFMVANAKPAFQSSASALLLRPSGACDRERGASPTRDDRRAFSFG